MGVTITILSFSVFALSIPSYVIDQDGTIVPCTTVVLSASMFSFVGGILLTRDASRNDDSYTKAGNKAGDWNDDNRLGKSLTPREDLYSWALVICFNRDYLAQILFFKKREAEKKKKEDALTDAKEQLGKSREIDKEGDFA